MFSRKFLVVFVVACVLLSCTAAPNREAEQNAKRIAKGLKKQLGKFGVQVNNKRLQKVGTGLGKTLEKTGASLWSALLNKIGEIENKEVKKMVGQVVTSVKKTGTKFVNDNKGEGFAKL